MREYIIINDDNSVSIAPLASDGHLPPDERDDICSIAEAKPGDYQFPAFIDQVGKICNLDKLGIADYLNLLTIYRKS